MQRLNGLSSIPKFGIQLALITLLLTSCSPTGQTKATPKAAPTSVTETTQLQYAEVVFSVSTPKDTPPQDPVYLDVLDEVTGLGLNPVRYPLEEKSANQFEAHIPVIVGSTVKYRYLHGAGTPAIEYTSTGSQVRYRIQSITGPITVQDIVSGWSDLPYTGKGGRVYGKVVNSSTSEPIPGMMVECAGQQTFTGGDGSFRFDDVEPGTHTLATMSLDGTYHTYQQGAEVAVDTGTQALLQVEKAKTVKVTFIANVPTLPVENATVRVIGSLTPLGNTFADLAGGMNTLASRAPAMTKLADGQYSLVMKLPIGTDLRYKYSLGDGFWNAEHTQNGKFNVRQLIVPSTDTVIQDTVSSWSSSPDTSPILFSVTSPDTTPKNDIVSIQLNPFGWTEPIPMWSTGENSWKFALYNPLGLENPIAYRYCRNDQCDTAAEVTDPNASEQHISFTSQNSDEISNEISSWNNWSSSSEATKVVSAEITARDKSFIAGIEISPDYDPSWLPYLESSIGQITQAGANAVILTPTWTNLNPTLPVFRPTSGKDILWQDMISAGSVIKKKEMNILVFPELSLGLPSSTWWSQAYRDTNWWQTWFDSYSAFIINSAEYADQVEARGIVIGGPWIDPALPEGVLSDGSPSGVPGDAEARWESLITEIRDRYQGTVIWAISSSDLSRQPAFLKQIDAFYVLWSPSLVSSDEAANRTFTEEFSRLLDENLAPFQLTYSKPVYIAIDYPSAQGASKGCIDLSGQCQPFDVLNAHSTMTEIPIDLQVQVDLYNAAFESLNSRTWINGIISRGYYPPVTLKDSSSSIHGKPAWDVVWYWFPRLLGKTK
jgi:hypothetical protein